MWGENNLLKIIVSNIQNMLSYIYVICQVIVWVCHLKDKTGLPKNSKMVKRALGSRELEVPTMAEGSFMHLDDLVKGFEFPFLN